jgi:hypothetical protein
MSPRGESLPVRVSLRNRNRDSRGTYGGRGRFQPAPRVGVSRSKIGVAANCSSQWSFEQQPLRGLGRGSHQVSRRGRGDRRRSRDRRSEDRGCDPRDPEGRHSEEVESEGRQHRYYDQPPQLVRGPTARSVSVDASTANAPERRPAVNRDRWRAPGAATGAREAREAQEAEERQSSGRTLIVTDTTSSRALHRTSPRGRRDQSAGARIRRDEKNLRFPRRALAAAGRAEVSCCPPFAPRRVVRNDRKYDARLRRASAKNRGGRPWATS